MVDRACLATVRTQRKGVQAVPLTQLFSDTRTMNKYVEVGFFFFFLKMSRSDRAVISSDDNATAVVVALLSCCFSTQKKMTHG
jgi:hypothetical protein